MLIRQAPPHHMREDEDIVRSCEQSQTNADSDVGSAYPGAEAGTKGLAVRQLKSHASWVQTVITLITSKSYQCNSKSEPGLPDRGNDQSITAVIQKSAHIDKIQPNVR